MLYEFCNSRSCGNTMCLGQQAAARTTSVLTCQLRRRLLRQVWRQDLEYLFPPLLQRIHTILVAELPVGLHPPFCKRSLEFCSKKVHHAADSIETLNGGLACSANSIRRQRSANEGAAARADARSSDFKPTQARLGSKTDKTLHSQTAPPECRASLTEAAKSGRLKCEKAQAQTQSLLVTGASCSETMSNCAESCA